MGFFSQWSCKQLYFYKHAVFLYLYFIQYICKMSLLISRFMFRATSEGKIIKYIKLLVMQLKCNISIKFQINISSEVKRIMHLEY